MIEKIKSVPIPIWIGLGLILIVIFVLNMKSNSSSNATPSAPVTATAGPVTTSTVGTQGSQNSPGTDQELGNLSVITQSGFAQIAQQEQGNNQLLTGIANGMNGVGPGMRQFGGTIQSSQNGSAANNAVNGTPGQNAGATPSSVTTNQ
jgi:hypothetical protein